MSSILNKYVATGVNIYSNCKHMLTLNEVHQWRYDSYQDLLTRRSYTLGDIKALNVQFPTEDLVISTIMKEKENQGYHIIYMAFDSSTVCDVDVLNKIKNIKTIFENKYDSPVFLFFVDTYISLIENKYKLANIEKYKCVTPEYLQKYINFVESNSTGEFNGDYGIDFIYKVDFLSASEALCVEEAIPILNVNKIREKNERNDNAQIEILSDLRGRMNSIDCIILTHDKGMIEKCKKKNIHTCTLIRNRDKYV